MRIDKWLWVARFFKTRSLASVAIASHKIRCNGDHVKPARDLKVGDELEITIGQTVAASSLGKGSRRVAGVIQVQEADRYRR